jgi:hypothetical protein
MNLLRRTLCVALSALIVSAVAIVPVSAESKDTDWNKVKQVKRGQQVQVVLSDARDYRGAFERWSDSGIVVQLASGEQTFARPDVIRIAVLRKERSRLRHSLIGAGIGAGVGLLVGAVADHGCNNCWFPNLGKEIFPPLGGIIGAGIGVALPKGGSRVIYRAP